MATKKQTQEVPATPEEQCETLLADLLEKRTAYEDAQAKYQEFVSENPDTGVKQASLTEIRDILNKNNKTESKQEAE